MPIMIFACGEPYYRTFAYPTPTTDVKGISCIIFYFLSIFLYKLGELFEISIWTGSIAYQLTICFLLSLFRSPMFISFNLYRSIYSNV